VLAVSRLVLRHKLVVLAFWLAALAAGIAASGGLGSRLSQQVALPGVASYRANQEIHGLHGNGGGGYVEVAVVRLPSGEPAASAAGHAALSRAFGAVSAIPGLRVADYPSTGDRAFLTSDSQMSYGLVFTPFEGEQAPSLAPKITAAMTPVLPAGASVRVTGMTELASGGQAQQAKGWWPRR
jgi:RND superfamily putative drug exporter